MKFKTPGVEPVMVGLTSGHTCVIHPEGTDVEPRFRREAIARGCVPVGMGDEYVDAANKPDPTIEEKIVLGIEKMLDGDDEDAFNADGKPDVRKLSAALGFNVSALQRDQAWGVVSAKLKAGEEAE